MSQNPSHALLTSVAQVLGAVPRVSVLALCVAVAVAVLAGFAYGQMPLAASTGGALALALAVLAFMLARDTMVTALIRHDPLPCFVTDGQGRLVASNAAARGDARVPPPATDGPADEAAAKIAHGLRDRIVSSGSVLLRMQDRARRDGAAREVVAAADGPVTLSLHRLRKGRYLWRMDGMDTYAAALRGGDGLSLPMLTANAQGTILFANAALRRMVGFRPRDLARDLGLSGDLPNGQIITLRGPQGECRTHLSVYSSASGRREVYLSPAPHAPREPLPTLTMTGLEDLPVPLLRFAADGRLLASNRAARDLVGLGDADRPRVQDILDGLGRPVRDWLSDVARGQHPSGSEVLQLVRDDGELFVQVTLRQIPVATVPDTACDVLAILQDATTLKRMEAQYVQSQKMQAIGQLAGGVAHDFNNLLTAISGHCDLMLLRKRAGDSDHADLVQISQNANRAAALVTQLLAFSRKQTMKPERIDLREALADLTHLLTRLVGEKIDLRLTHHPELGPVRADRRQIDQVIMNLVVNARDAMPEGGLIRLETEDIRLTADLQRHRAVVPAGRYALIRVRDEGIGIPADRHDKIFEPFFTTKRPGEGTGLGLSMVYGIIKQSGGFIFVNSAVGEGSTFEIWLPVQDMPAVSQAMNPAVTSAADGNAPRTGEGVVLLVEDEPPVRAFAARALRLRGHSVLEADTAEEALRILSDPDLHVDVFVTDVVMPGLDGPTWVAEALKARPDVRIVFMSGYAEDYLADMPQNLPGSVFLPKPFSLADLTLTVQRQMDGDAKNPRIASGDHASATRPR